MEPDSECQTRILSDEPVGTDEFGSHERVSNAIAGLVESEQSGKSIALTGPWGSGKSTIVELVRGRLGESKKSKVLVFDAWAHKGDHLRRAFLEGLIKWFRGCEWYCNEDKWQKELQKLRKVLDEEDRLRIPIFPPVVRLSLLLAVYVVPIGLLLLNASLAKFDRANFLLGSIAVALPLVVVGGWCGLRWLRSDNGATRRSHSLSALITGRATWTQHITFRTPEPSSIEFQEKFSELLHDALGNKDRRLLIVVDNLDRVEAEEALSIWATMRTFFDLEQLRKHTWRKRLWLLVPTDKLSVKRLWQAPAPGKGEERSKFGEETASAFIDKSFQVEFHVPPQALSDWQGYMRRRLHEAFQDYPNLDAPHFHAVCRIFQLLLASELRSPTPRDIKVFINKVAAIRLQWKRAIPLPQQALYVALRAVKGSKASKESMESKILKLDVLGPIPEELAGQGWRGALASIHFNLTDRDKAMELLLGDRIAVALRKGEPQLAWEPTLSPDVQELDAFAMVCERVIDMKVDSWANTGNEHLLANAARAFARFSIDPNDHYDACWERLCDAAASVTSWSDVDKKVGEGLVALVKKRPTADFVGHVVETLAESLEERDYVLPGPDTRLEAWLDGVLEVLDNIRNDFEDIIIERFRVKGLPQNYTTVVSRLGLRNGTENCHRFFTPKEPAADVIGHIAKRPEEGKFAIEISGAVKVMAALRTKVEWEPAIRHFSARLEGDGDLVEVVGSIQSLLHLESAGKLPGGLAGNVPARQKMDRHMDTAIDPENSRAVALCALVALLRSKGRYESKNRKINDVMSNPEGHASVVAELAELTAEFHTEDVIREHAPDTPLAKATLDRMEELGSV